MMKTTANRAIALIFDAKRIKSVSTNVFKSAQILAEPLHEYRATAKDGSKPVAVIGDIGNDAKQAPYLTESCLFILKRYGIDQGARPNWIGSSHLSCRRLSSYENLRRPRIILWQQTSRSQNWIEIKRST